MLDAMMYHGSAKQLLEFKAPSFRRPLYLTPDLEYAMAFCTKPCGGCNELEDDACLSLDNAYVHATKLKPSCRVFDFTAQNADEFKDVFYSIVDESLMAYLENRHASNDIYELCSALAFVLMMPALKAGLDYMKSDGHVPEKTFSKTVQLCRSFGIEQPLDDMYDVHFTMSFILEKLARQGYACIKTYESDFNEEVFRKPVRVKTQNAFGVFMPGQVEGVLGRMSYYEAKQSLHRNV